jgi:trigger factor
MQAIAYLKPKMSIDYSNVEVEKPEISVSEADVDAEIEQNRTAQAVSIPILDRGLEFGDLVTMSFTGYLDGVPFKGGSASRQQLTLSPTQFIPGFAEQILGMTPETSKTIEVRFPENYSAEQLAGKSATFDITVHDLSRKELPALDDEFAKTCGYDSLDALKQGTRNELEKRQQEAAKAQTESLIITQLLSRAEVAPIPQSMVKRYLDQMLQQQLNQLGLSEKDYFAKINSDRDKFDQTYYHIAKRDIKVQLILDHIAQNEGFQVSNEEYEEYMSTEAVRYGFTVEQLKQVVTREQAEGRVKMRKAYDFLLAAVQYVERPLAKEVISNLEVDTHTLT